MSRRALVLFGLGAAVGVGSAFIWPGDLENEPLTVGHWVAVGGFFLTAVLLVIGAVLLAVAVVSGAWKVDDFRPNEYLENMKKGRDLS